MQRALASTAEAANMSAICATGSSRALRIGQQKARSSRQRLVVHAADKLCKDMVSAPNAPYSAKGEVYKVTFMGAAGEARVVDCPDDMYILDAAERAGLDLPATCRGGICGACVGRVVSGSVDQSDIQDLSFTVSEDEQAQGMALICMSRAQGDVSIETQCDWGYSLGVGEWKGASGKFSASPDPLMGDKWAEASK